MALSLKGLGVNGGEEPSSFVIGFGETTGSARDSCSIQFADWTSFASSEKVRFASRFFGKNGGEVALSLRDLGENGGEEALNLKGLGENGGVVGLRMVRVFGLKDAAAGLNIVEA